MKYTFTSEDHNGNKITSEIVSEDTLSSLLRHIKYFLQACSFQFRLEEEIEVVDNSLQGVGYEPVAERLPKPKSSKKKSKKNKI